MTSLLSSFQDILITGEVSLTCNPRFEMTGLPMMYEHKRTKNVANYPISYSDKGHSE